MSTCNLCRKHPARESSPECWLCFAFMEEAHEQLPPHTARDPRHPHPERCVDCFLTAHPPGETCCEHELVEAGHCSDCGDLRDFGGE